VEWADEVRVALGLPDTESLDREDVDLILDLAKDAAHSVARPAAPLTAYLLGIAVGRGADPEATARLLGVDHDELSRLALSAPAGAGGLVLVPYLEGERTPNRPDATGTLHGIRLATSTRPHLARAYIEGMLCGLADGLDALRAQGVPVERVMLIGGAAQSPAVQEIAPQVFGLPISVPEPGEYVADGAARQAAWVLAAAGAAGSEPTTADAAGAPAPPAWSATMSTTLDADPRPVIREQYAGVRDLV
jgi:xylulokinase